MKKYFRHIAFFLLLSGCIRPFEFDVLTYKELVVVDAHLSDSLMVHSVNLSFTYPIDEDAANPILGATVFVLDDQGNQFDYSEGINGNYQSTLAYQAEVGRKYRLSINYGSKEYQSKWMELISSPPIDSVYYKFTEQPSEEFGRNLRGIQFFLDSHDDAGKSKYFRYEWEETYKIIVPYPSSYDYDISTRTWTYRDTPVGICYESGNSNQFILANSLGSTTNRITEMPIRYHDEYSQALRDRYYIHVRQYSFDSETYNYYRRLKENIEGGGSLFDKQQGSIIGNMEAIHDAAEPVLGYFEVAGISQHSIFVNKRDLPKAYPRSPYIYYCFNSLISTTPDSVHYYLTLGDKYQIVNLLLNPGQNQADIAPINCTDCSWYAPVQPPDFWKD